MHSIIRTLVASLIIVWGSVSYAHAQTPAAPAPVPPAATAPAPSAPAAPAPVITAATINVTSESARDIKKSITVRGQNLDAVQTYEVAGPVATTITVVDNTSKTSNTLSMDIPKDASGEYTLMVNGTEVPNFKVIVKDQATVRQERIERQAAAGAAAATKVAAQEKLIAALTAEVNAIKARPTVTQEQINALVAKAVTPIRAEVGEAQKAVVALDQRIDQVNTNERVLAEAVAEIAATEVKTGLFSGKKPLNSKVAERIKLALATASEQMLAKNDK